MQQEKSLKGEPQNDNMRPFFVCVFQSVLLVSSLVFMLYFVYSFVGRHEDELTRFQRKQMFLHMEHPTDWDYLLVSGWKGLCVSRSKPWRCYPLLRHPTPPHLLIRTPSQRKHGPMIPVCSSQALIHQAQDSYFLSRHGKVALNSDVVERKPFSFAWKELKSNNCLSSRSPCGIKGIINA